ncbi:Cytosolic sulfotransferase 7 [Raphanus sativus]|uniref:Sulfotransferase n=1 Tax=Raphanus sativus TaxID=3726 RepID=A0A6J0KJB9_RAPSA|nr:cytosolic sulfotransferase 7 [Raphanus sativus]KAJ4870007.1 Cytosolic sulfotransferase 7 [Raphanus sativus]
MDVNEISKYLQRDEQETISLISSLPSDIDFNGTKLFKYQSCWYDNKTLQGILNFQRGFKPQETDIIISSLPKSGTTWLKALTVALLERSKHSTNHPLLSDNPHGLVPVLELRLYIETSEPDLTSFSSTTPRLFSTHVPFHTLQEALKSTPCKVVYVWRNVKDALVSLWFFECANHKIKIDEERSLLESMFESFCRGVSYYGPFWEHVLSYWRGSLEDSKNVLFLRYEELKVEPRGQVKRLAEFLGVPFSVEEEESGCVEKILDLCSLDNLKNLEVNKTGKTARGVEHKNFFRKGEVGDSKNYLTPEMEKKIDMIIEERFRGANLKF